MAVVPTHATRNNPKVDTGCEPPGALPPCMALPNCYHTPLAHNMRHVDLVLRASSRQPAPLLSERFPLDCLDCGTAGEEGQLET
eukprot:583180-Rhodomonas_salina.1